MLLLECIVYKILDMKNNYFLPIIAVVIVLLLSYFAWYVLGPKVSSPDQKLIIYKEYVNETFNFSITYPEIMEVKERNDTIAFILEGPTQGPNTEGFDGVNVSFNLGDLSESNTGNLEGFVNEKFLQDKQNLEIIDPLKPVNLGGVDGYSYRFSGAGRFTNYYLPVTDQEYLLISVFAEDPTNQGFDAMVGDMLTSLSVLTN